VTKAQFRKIDQKLALIAGTMVSRKQFGQSILSANMLTICIATLIVLLLTGCTLRPTEVAAVNGIKTYSVTSNRIVSNTGNLTSISAALRELETEAVPAYMASVCGDRGHRIINWSDVIDEPWTGGGGGRFIKQTFLVQCR